MKIIRSKILNQFPEIMFGFSTKFGLERPSPYYFNMSFSVGDNNNVVIENRKKFYENVGISYDKVSVQKQIHSDIITVVNDASMKCESDAMITNKSGIGLAISSADCNAIFIYDSKNKVIVGVHSGWMGTQKRILEKSLIKLEESYNSNAEDLYVFMAPSISQNNYEVSKDFKVKFDSKYLLANGDKFLLDLKSANYDMLLDFGIPKKNIEVSNLCSFETEYLHSYRRDGKVSGRAHGLIFIKEN